jgi:hypothetical protein
MGLTRIRADQVANIGYTTVRVVTLDNVNLTGGAPTVVDGTTLLENDKILVVSQTDGSQNGIYRVSVVGTSDTSTWVRAPDFNQTGEIEAGLIVMVTEGTGYADTLWKLITDNPIAVGQTVLTFVRNSAFDFGNIYANGVSIMAATESDTVTFIASNSLSITANAESNTIEFSTVITSAASGNTGEIQFNVNDSFASSTSLTFDGSELTVQGNVVATNFNSVNADLAEIYLTDSDYEPGTVVIFGGTAEVTQSIKYADSAIAGVISTSPAYIMNTGSTGAPIALQGRVPCKVVGAISKGNLLTSSNIPGVATKLDVGNWIPGCVIGKALESYNSDTIGIIEVVVGRT